MFVVSVDPNVVHVPLITTGCCKTEFDSTYPIRLNGIIGQEEFQQSIKTINQKLGSRIPIIIISVIFILCIVGGITLFVVGGITAVTSRSFGFPVLVGVGFGVFGFGILILSFACFCIQVRRTTRMRKAIADESVKYSTRSPTPCSWRLHSSTWSQGYGNQRRTTVVYRLDIDIGNRLPAGNGNAQYQFSQVPPQSTSFYPQQNFIPPSSSYDSSSAAGFCSQCGIARQNRTARFCPSCGQPYTI